MFLRRQPGIFLLVVVADAAADLLAGLLKSIVDEERPPLRYAQPRPLVHVPRDGSFPSGHAATSFACATVLSAFAPRLAPAFFVLAVAIGYSRVYTGVHYPFDVVGGALLGAAVATALLLLARARQRSPRAPRAG